ncbi:MAG: efflux transporter outer membrane subunit [Parachlamydiales bacterium]|nr:efflux transporter outer membrane subunit [Parachlamydiales bacterium]
MKKYIFVFILFTGCMMGPDYKKPVVLMPNEFSEISDKNDNITSLKDWWKQFDDPSLDNLIELAIKKNYNLKIALEKIEETRAFYRIKKADLFPEIDMTASAIRYGISKNIIQTNLIPNYFFNIFRIGFDANWEIDFFGKLRREKESALYTLQAMQENMRDVYVTIISDVARYYVDICALQNIIEKTQEKILLQKKILKLVQSRNKSGLDSKIKEKDQIAKLKAEEENLFYYSTLVKQTYYLLATLIGETPENVSEEFIKFNKIPNAENKKISFLPSSLLRNRPDIKEAERKLASATAQIGAAVAQYFPSFSLLGTAELLSSKISSLFSSDSYNWSFGSPMSWPIITFDRIRANVDMKKSLEKQALFFYENTVLNALKDVESSLVAYFNEQKKLNDIKEEFLAISDVTFLEESKYLNGLIDLSYYLEQKSYLIDKNIKKIESERSLSHDLIAVYKSLGGGEW